MKTIEFITVPGPYAGKCRVCGIYNDDMRMGVCFDCVTKGDERLHAKSVCEHIKTGCSHWRCRDWWMARIDFRLAFERATKTGDYKQI